jgi:hypothetical protein
LLISRKKCPLCLSTELKIVFKNQFLEPPVLDYIKPPPAKAGGIEERLKPV